MRGNFKVYDKYSHFTPSLAECIILVVLLGAGALVGSAVTMVFQYFFGNGAGKCKAVIQHPNAIFIDGIEPLAKHMVPLAERKFLRGEFEDTAYFEPFYLKEFIAGTPKKML